MDKSELPVRMQPALSFLVEAWDYARDAGRDIRDFAIGIAELIELGARPIDLRWLVYKGYTDAIMSGRDRRKGSPPNLTDRTTLVLTPLGERFVRQTTILPHFDAIRHEFRYGTTVLKHFRSRAPAQERILADFEVQGWRAWIASPFSGNSDGKRQLREVVKSLNRNQHPRLIHFHYNGNRIYWEILEVKRDTGDLPPTAP